MSEAPVSVRYLIIDAAGIVLWEKPPRGEVGRSLASLLKKEDGTALSASELRPGKGLRCRDQDNAELELFVDEIGGRLGEGNSLVLLFSLNDLLFSYQAAAQVKLRSTIGSIIAGFAHEVRNPLSAIVALIELTMLSPGLSHEASESIAKIPGLLFRIEQLLKSTLSYGRPKPPQAAWHQLPALLEKVLESMSFSKLKLTKERWVLPSDSLPIYADTEHTLSILTNLLTNAAQAAKTPAGVWIEVQRHSPNTDGACTCIDIHDDGPGIPLAQQDKIFEPFFTTKPRGTGLGLALARDLARMNKGDVLLLQTSPRGSTFRLCLPCRPESDQPP
jgi:signal transduction histidine kinase